MSLEFSEIYKIAIPKKQQQQNKKKGKILIEINRESPADISLFKLTNGNTSKGVKYFQS